MLPLVSCLCPTYNRREFWPRSLDCFQSQDYPNLELVILDDGDPVLDLMPDSGLVHYYHELPKRNHGQKLNRCSELARGEFIIIWDDDDWYAPDRVSKQIQPMLDDPTIQVAGTSTLYYYTHGTEQAFQYVNRTTRPWLAAFAARMPVGFNDKPRGADFDFLNTIPQGQWCDLHDLTLLVSTIHSGNAAPKLLPSPAFVAVPWNKLPWGRDE